MKKDLTNISELEKNLSGSVKAHVATGFKQFN
jgi:hypothetical protein